MTTRKLAVPSVRRAVSILAGIMLGSFGAGVAATTTLAASTICGSPLHVNLRLPPSLNPAVDSHPPRWEPPPEPWLYGNWKITHTSDLAYVPLWNMEFDNYPVLPTCEGKSPSDCPQGTFPGQNVDLQTWTAVNDSSNTILSAFGYDTPRRTRLPIEGAGWNGVWDFAGTGALNVTSTWELIAYGHDEDGHGYIVAYETEASSHYWPAAIDIESRVAHGPSQGTYRAIIRALQALKNQEINAILTNMTQLVHNDRRKSLPPFVCGPACVNNTGLGG